MKISIIVPVYNVEKYIERCVESLLHQDLDAADYEIILVNDGSTDQSESIAKALVDKYSNVHLYSQTNSGPSVARNTALAHATGDYIMFADADDEMMPNVIGQLYHICTEHRLDICIFTIKVLDIHGTPLSITRPSIPTDRIFTGEEAILHGIDIGSLWKGIYSRRLIAEHELSFYPGIIHQDSDFNFSAYALAKRMMAVDVLGYVYYWNPLSLTREVSLPKKIKGIHDDIVIAHRLRRIGERIQLSRKLTDYYQRKSHSMAVSTLLRIYRDKTILRTHKSALINKMIECRLCPAFGRTESIKTTILMPFLYLLTRFDKWKKTD